MEVIEKEEREREIKLFLSLTTPTMTPVTMSITYITLIVHLVIDGVFTCRLNLTSSDKFEMFIVIIVYTS